MSFTIFQNEKTPFQAVKTRSSNIRKIDIFAKGFSHGFGLKTALFPSFIFHLIQARKMSFTVFQQKKKPFQAINKKTLKSQKIDIFPRGLTHGFGPKMALFPTFFFQAIQDRKMSFTILYIEKTPLQPIKTKSSKSRKTDIFTEGLTHGFGIKMALFSTFVLSNISQENVFYGILEQKKTLSRL